MDAARLSGLLDDIRRVRLGILGDFCLDAYWTMDPDQSERSVETGKPVQRVLSQRYGLGGAGNVAANAAAIGVHALQVFGVVGDDLFGREMMRRLGYLGAGCDGMVVAPDWYTTVYAKPLDGVVERERFDFGTLNEISPATEAELLRRLEDALDALDALIVNQQIPRSYLSPNVIVALNAIAAKTKCTIVVDSRNASGAFRNVVLKVNAAEAAALCGAPTSADDPAAAEEYARTLHARTGRPVVVTCGAHGILVFDGTAAQLSPVIPVRGPIDTVGAGDTVTAVIAALLGAGASLRDAVDVANVATNVTVRKLQQTGTATPQEMLAVLGGA